MTLPFQPERSELLQPATAGGNALNAEFSRMIQGTQKLSTDKPQVLSADGSQLVIPPLGQTAPTGDQATGLTAAGKPGTTADAATAQAPTAQAPAEQLPQSVAYDSSLRVPSWQRFSQTPVATDGSMLPPTPVGDPGPMMPMWMRLAPPAIQALLEQQQAADASAAAAQSKQGQPTVAADGSDANATASTDQTKVAQVPTDATDANATTNQLPGGQTGALVT